MAEKKPATVDELRHALEQIVRTTAERAAEEAILYCGDIADGFPDVARRHLERWAAYKLTLSTIHVWTGGEFGVRYDVERERMGLIESAKTHAPEREA